MVVLATSFNRRHAGRSILTYPRSLSRMLIKCYVSIDGTLADQFLLDEAKKANCKQEFIVSIDGTLADQFLHYESSLWEQRVSLFCFNRRHAGRSILTNQRVSLCNEFSLWSFNRRHAGRSILTPTNSTVSVATSVIVSIDGTLADQFLLQDVQSRLL